ncbi:MAG: D-alanyl-D-alanine carboxypeptidase/D-alanyl-D-alanine-endopeptidase [Bdellovibrionia bacterium]
MISNLRFIIILVGTVFVLNFVSAKAFATVPKGLEEYSKIADRVTKKFKISEDDIGMKVSVGDGEDSHVLWSINATKKMIPASISKIITASAVLDVFPPGTKVKTQLLMDGKVSNRKLKGNLYLKGAGDPGFVSENMWFLVNDFLRNEIDEIEGDIIVDDSLFDQKRFDDSRQSQRVDRAYDAPVGAMSFNWNSVNIFVRPGTVGEPAKVFIDPVNSYIQLSNRSKTVAGARNELIADRDPIKGSDGDRVIVGGKIGVAVKEITVFKNITEPDLWSGYNLKSFLQQRNISHKGKIRNGVTPASADVVAQAESKPIENMVSDMNKFSNNYVAEMLTKLMATSSEKPASLKTGVQLINKHLESLKIPKNEYEFYNPSGLTRENQFSANAMWMVLTHLRDDFRVQPELLTSLPIAGVDGTLKRRLKGEPTERWIRAKTGYLNDVVTLAGYAGRRDGQVLTFTFIYNGKADEAKVRQYFDELLVEMVKQL